MPKTITLEKPLVGHGGTRFTTVTLRDPGFRDYMDLGNPYTWVSLPDGGGFEEEAPGLVEKWIARLCDCDPNFLDFATLADAFALRDAVKGFFRAAQAAVLGLKSESGATPDTSSSGSDSTP